MQSKLGLVALSVMATLVLFGGNTAEAKSGTTEKKVDEKPAVVAEQPTIITIKTGDTLADIAASHNTSYVRLFNANDKIANPDMIYVGDSVRIPNNDEQLPDRFGQLTAAVQAQIIAADTVAQTTAQAPVAATAPAQATTQTIAQPVAHRGVIAGNGYVWGQCTWYVKSVRPDLPNNLGNGGSWVANAAAMGLPTGNVPQVGAVAEEPGHVAYVEAVNGSMISISEMNYAGGVGVVHRRTVPAANYRYIY